MADFQEPMHNVTCIQREGFLTTTPLPAPRSALNHFLYWVPLLLPYTPGKLHGQRIMYSLCNTRKILGFNSIFGNSFSSQLPAARPLQSTNQAEEEVSIL
jgi:hypothetical protein